jgi:hypothetical protein
MRLKLGMKPLTLLAVAAISPSTARAASYAGEPATYGRVGSFYLNENASSYTITFSDGASQTVLNPTAGLQSFVRPSSTDTFSISVTTHDLAGWTSGTASQIGADSALTTFSLPYGVAVDQNPGPNFGLIYVANGSTQTTAFASASGVSRASDGQGIYALNSDQSDAFGYGNTAMSAGISQLSTAGGYVNDPSPGAPYHLAVGPDDNLYVTGATPTAGNIYRINSNLTSGYNLLYGYIGTGANGQTAAYEANAIADNHGYFLSSPVVTINNSGNVSIYAVDAYLNTSTTTTPNYQSIREYNIGTESGAPTAPVPETFIANPVTAADGGNLNTFVGNLTTDLAIGPSDKRFYYMEDRDNKTGNVQPGLFVIDPTTGATIFDSLQETLTLNLSATFDKIAAVSGMAISPDNKYLAFIVALTYSQGSATISLGNQIDIVPLDATIGGIAGLPDLSKMLVIPDAFPNSTGYARDIAFDAADNIYAASLGDEMIRVFSPGGTSVDVTSYNGSGYTFSQSVISPEPLGDANGDGMVNAADLAILNAHMGQHITGGYINGDFNDDGVVNEDDFALYSLGLAEYNASTTAVPEPAGFIAVAGIGLAVTLRGRRRNPS